MTQNYDTLVSKLDAAIAEFERKGGAADTIVLAPLDLAVIAGTDAVTYTPGHGDRLAGWYGKVRIMEGAPFDHSYVDGHDYRRQPSKILL